MKSNSIKIFVHKNEHVNSRKMFSDSDSLRQSATSLQNFTQLQASTWRAKIVCTN